jgi:hypothetical protein
MCLCLCLSASSQAATDEPPPGFIPLFNGKDLTGWQGREQVDPDAFRSLTPSEQHNLQAKADEILRQHWRVDAGELVNDGHGTYCTTIKDYGDFELLIDWKMVDPNADSGIYLRGNPQVQIWNPDDPVKRQYQAHLGSGSLWNNKPDTPGQSPLIRADRPIGQWNTFRICIVDNCVTVHFNEQLVVDDAVMQNFWDPQKPIISKGPIQLQTHGGEMRFRRIYLRELPE